MQKNILFLFVPIFLLFSCKSESESYNDIVKKASEIKESAPKQVKPNTKDSTIIIAENDQGSISEEEIVSTEIEKGKKSEQLKKAVEPAQSQKLKKKAVRGKGIMTFDNRVHEFGTIKEGDIIKHDFYFTNTGKGPITVKKASATCGCTVPSYPFIPINPGERGYIGVTYNSVGKSGVQTPVVTIVSDAKENSLKLKLTGSVIEKTEEAAEKQDSSALPQ